MMRHYLKSLLLSLKKNRFFYIINLIGFVSGFLVVTIIFTFVYQELSFDRFHKNAENIYRIHPVGYGVTPFCFADRLKNQIPEITGIVRISSRNLSIVINDKEVNIGRVCYTDPEVFRVFSFKLLSGSQETILNTSYSIVINRTTANNLYGKASPIGELIREKDGTIYTITGIMDDIPYNSHIKANAFVSIETLRPAGGDKTFDCGNWSCLTYISLSQNSNPVETEKKINSALKDFLMGPKDSKIPLKIESLKKIYFDYDNNKYDGSEHGNLQIVTLYMAIAFLILVIVIINYINLSTAISGTRIKEFVIRKVNGASGIHIITQVLLEALGVAVISFIITSIIIRILLPYLSNQLNIPVSSSVNLSLLNLYCFFGVVITGIITGAIPGQYISKISEIKALKSESIFSKTGLQRKILLIIQLMIVAVLLNSTFIIKKQINYILNKDLGFNYENVIYFELSNSLMDKKELVRSSLLRNPKIENVSFSDALTGEGFGKSTKKIGDIEKLCYFCSVDPDFLELYKINIKYGRNFSRDLKTDFTNSCIINEAACKAFGIENPVNKLMGNKEIIGVVKDFNFTSLHNKIEPLVINCGYGKVAQVKITGEDQSGTLQFVKKTCMDIAADFEGDYSFLNNRIKKLYKSESDLKVSFAVYSVMTLIIALLGLFGLTLFLIKKKTKEVSVRKLYGSRLIDTFKLFTTEQIRIVVISNVLAVPLSLLVMTLWLNNFQYRVDIGFLIFLKTFLITTIFNFLAISFFIIKTHRTNLIETLKYE